MNRLSLTSLFMPPTPFPSTIFWGAPVLPSELVQGERVGAAAAHEGRWPVVAAAPGSAGDEADAAAVKTGGVVRALSPHWLGVGEQAPEALLERNGLGLSSMVRDHVDPSRSCSGQQLRVVFGAHAGSCIMRRSMSNTKGLLRTRKTPVIGEPYSRLPM